MNIRDIDNDIADDEQRMHLADDERLEELYRERIARLQRRKILLQLTELWEKYPMLRFGQLISNVMYYSDNTSLFCVDDYKLSQLIKDFPN